MLDRRIGLDLIRVFARFSCRASPTRRSCEVSMQQWEYAQIHHFFSNEDRWVTWVHFSSGEQSREDYTSYPLTIAGRLGDEGWEMVHFQGGAPAARESFYHFKRSPRGLETP